MGIKSNTNQNKLRCGKLKPKKKKNKTENKTKEIFGYMLEEAHDTISKCT